MHVDHCWHPQQYMARQLRKHIPALHPAGEMAPRGNKELARLLANPELGSMCKTKLACFFGCALQENGATGNKGLAGLLGNPVLSTSVAGLATAATAFAAVEVMTMRITTYGQHCSVCCGVMCPETSL